MGINNSSLGRRSIAGAAWLIGVALYSCCAFAQTPPGPTNAAPSATDAAGKKVYTSADFSRFAPRDALEMLRQVPGFSIRQSNQDRGLGQASENVLLNGQRIANKSGGAVAELEKISADQVERIEIVDGATLDLPGLSGPVANVMTKQATGGSGHFGWTPEISAHFADPIFTRGEISYSARLGPINYTLGFDSDGFRSGSGGGTTIFDADRERIELRDDVVRFRQDFPKASARFTIDGPGGSTGNANIAYNLDRQLSDEVSRRERLDGTASIRSIRTRTRASKLELSGDFAFRIAGGGLKLISLATREHRPSISTAIFSFPDGSPSTGDRFDSDNHSKETIGRAEYSWKWGRSDFQISAEAAFNSLKSVTHLFALDGSGSFIETPFPAGSGRVKEDRYELSASYGRPLGPRLTLQLIAGGERSTLEAGGVARTFMRPKGTLSLAWQAGDKTDVSFKLVRRVGQLNFGDFLASVNLADDRQNASNINLVPPQSWEVDLEFIRDLKTWGTSRLRFFARKIDDTVDFIPVGDVGQAVGNIASAKRYGVEWISTFLLDPLGWKGAKLDTTVRFEHSRVRDPLTGEPRPISLNLKRRLILDLRHDIPGSDWAWGLHAFYEHFAFNFRLTEISRTWDGPVFLNAYVENKNALGLTVRATVENLADVRNLRHRTVFDGRRTDPILFIERRNRKIGPSFVLSVRGNF